MAGKGQGKGGRGAGGRGSPGKRGERDMGARGLPPGAGRLGLQVQLVLESKCGGSCGGGGGCRGH